jgi:prepilin peptidase CpaA
MNEMLSLQLAPMLAGLAIALWTDCRARRLPNWLTLAMAVTGLLHAAVWAQPIDIGWAALGLIVGFGLMFVKFALGAAGGGDVKLMAAIGAWIGPMPVFQVFILYQVIGLFVVLAQAISQKRLQLLLKNSMVLTVNLASARHVGAEHVAATGQETRSLKSYMPDAVPITLAVLVVITLNSLKW